MNNLVIKIKVLSEGIFGSGESEANGVDVDILRDEIGVPYFKGKSFKGKLREEAETLKNYLHLYGSNRYGEIFIGLFGLEGKLDYNTLKFSNCKIASEVWNNLKYGINKGEFSKEDILNSLTEVRTFTRLNDDGIAEKGFLRQARVIKKDLTLYCNVECNRELSSIEKGFLASAVSSLRNLGTMESRGKGKVSCTLIEDGKDVTEKYIKVLEAEV